MKVFVISLLRSTERRKNVEKVLGEHGIAFEYIDAVDAVEGSHSLLTKFKPEKFLARHGRPSKIGEAGCYASHYLAWEKSVAINEPIIVLEDDFIVSGDLGKAIGEVEKIIERFGFIRLEGNKPTIEKEVGGFNDYSIVKFLKIPQCLTCYAIAPDTAKAFLEGSKEFIYPVDVFIRHQNYHKKPIFGLLPPPVQSAPEDITPSEIGNRHVDKGPLWCKFTKLAFKIKNLFLNVLTNIYHEVKGY